MKSFLEILNETKNTHITHLEDGVYMHGYDGAINAITFAKEVVKALESNTTNSLNLSVKWDGAPAIICGKNPDNGKFFVGTKSVFNKIPKINYTNADIDKNHSGGVVEKLKSCLQYLPDLGIDGVIQGDMMFSPGDVKQESVDGQMCLTFTPNTITYAVPVGSPLARRIQQAKIGIVFHTTYKGNSFSELRASPGANIGGLLQSRNVWFDDASFKNMEGTITFTAREKRELDTLLSSAESHATRLRGFLNFVMNNSMLQENIPIYLNSMIRGGTFGGSADGLIAFMESKFDVRINSLRQERAKQVAMDDKKKTIQFLESYKSAINAMFKLHTFISDAKLKIIEKLNTIKSLGSFVRTDDGFRYTGPEGYVASDTSGNVVKLVNRLEFSRINFTASKNWT